MFCSNEQREGALMTRGAEIGSVAMTGMESLWRFSARLGLNPLLVQASSGNTSIKTDGMLWVKASGKWLQDAEREEMFVPVELAAIRECLKRNISLPQDCSKIAAKPLTPSIETFMHAVLPQRVVAHVHSVNAIAWAVRQDAAAQLTQRLAGLRWRLIPYASSGSPLAKEMERAISADPGTDVFVLANHGLVVCGEDCEAVEGLLQEVEGRLEIQPRNAPGKNCELLGRLTETTQWRLPDSETLHGLGTDSVSLGILTGGVLYPCQALFLGRRAPVVPRSVAAWDVETWIDKQLGVQSFAILENSGVLVSASISKAELAMLGGLVEVLQRLDAAAPIRYLGEREVAEVLSAEGLHYRDSAEHR